MAGMRAVHKKDGTTFKFSGDLREAIEKSGKGIERKRRNRTTYFSEMAI